MQKDLWGEETAFTQNPKRSMSHSQVNRPALTLTSEDCIFFGHTWIRCRNAGRKAVFYLPRKGILSCL